jgi:Pectate lyase superfamily protein
MRMFGSSPIPSWRWAAALSPGLLLLVVLVLSGQTGPDARAQDAGAQAGPPAVGDEFVGPFASWADVKSTYGAVGDGIADDTGALQQAFSELGTPGHASVLYLPAGVYRITRTLSLAGKLHVSILGEHPASTRIRWNGPGGGDMVSINGVSHSRYGRITWDGAGSAAAIYNLGWAGGNYFPTLNEHADEVLQDAAYGIRAGTRDRGDAETSVLRCQFLRLSQAGLSVENFNVLDWWVWDSYFEDNEAGVTNTHGAGNFYVYNSVFKRSRSADLAIGNTGFFSFRRNYSAGSKRFFVAGPIGSAAAAITFQANTILDPSSRAIESYNPGPQLLLDNIIRSTGDPPVKLSEPYLVSPRTADLVGMGNTFAASNPYEVAGRLVSVDDQVVDASTIDAPEPTLPGVPPNLNRQVFEVAPGSDGGSIQSAINDAVAQAGGTRPVVHLAPGTYSLGAPLTIPAGSDVQLVGDGGTTILAWASGGSGPVIHLAGPSHATLRDLAVAGDGRTDGVLVDNADQAGGSIFLQSPSVNRSEVGYQVEDLGLSDVRVHDLEGDENTLHLRASAARAVAFGGAAGNHKRLFDVTRGATLVVNDVWHEGGERGAIQLTDTGNFTLDGSNLAGTPEKGVPTVSASGFRGRLTLATVITGEGTTFAVQPSGSGTQALFVGVEGRITNPFYSNTAPDAQAALIGSKLGTEGGGSAPVPDRVTNVPALPDFLRTMLADLRGAQPRTLALAADDVTDVRLFRVFVDQTRRGIVVRGPAT